MSGSTWTWIGTTIDLDSPSDWVPPVDPGNATDTPESGGYRDQQGTLGGLRPDRGHTHQQRRGRGVEQPRRGFLPRRRFGPFPTVVSPAASGAGSMIVIP